jgi:hypothetical protein
MPIATRFPAPDGLMMTTTFGMLGAELSGSMVGSDALLTLSQPGAQSQGAPRRPRVVLLEE